MQCVDVTLDLFEVVNALLHAWARGRVDTLATTAATAVIAIVVAVVVSAVVDVVPIHRAESSRRVVDKVAHDADELRDDLAVVVDERVRDAVKLHQLNVVFGRKLGQQSSTEVWEEGNQ